MATIHSQSSRSRPSMASSFRSILSGSEAPDSHPHSHKQPKGPHSAIPCIVDNQLGESLAVRSQRLGDVRDLGPPDLVHVSKYRHSLKEEEGQYHYCIGMDTSSIVQPLMYLQTILLNDHDHPGSQKHPNIATYCSYNCFSQGDVRIRCVFPGGAPLVQFLPCSRQKGAIVLDESVNGPLCAKIWRETYVSSLVRAILFCDAVDRRVPGMCTLNPVQSTKEAKSAVTTLCEMLPEGPALGCADLYNGPTLCKNLLVDALLQLVDLVDMHDLAIELIDKMEEPEKYNVLKVQMLLAKGDQAAAVKLMRSSLEEAPRDGWMLQVQTSFLLSKNRPDLALLTASRAVEAMPTEFVCWRDLVKVYILLKDYSRALLALNSAPMYSDKRKDVYPAIPPKSFDFPLPEEGRIASVWKDCETYGCVSGVGGVMEFSQTAEIKSVSEMHSEVYEQTKLKCTFKEAYNLLAIMTRRIGWTELLRIRSDIFVMEEEYNATLENEQAKEVQAQLQAAEDGSQQQLTVPDQNGNGTRSRSYSSGKISVRSLSQISSKFKRKRLSERWLDSLFVIFYENLKSVLIWNNDSKDREQLQHSALEWELIGAECFKVARYENGIPPYQTAFGGRFSILGCEDLLRYYLYYSDNEIEFRALHGIRNREGQTHAGFELPEDFVLELVCKLISWNYRYYGEFSVLSLQVLKKLIGGGSDSNATVVLSKIDILFDWLGGPSDQKNVLTVPKSPKKEGRRRSQEHRQGISNVMGRYVTWLNQFQPYA